MSTQPVFQVTDFCELDQHSDCHAEGCPCACHVLAGITFPERPEVVHPPITDSEDVDPMPLVSGACSDSLHHACVNGPGHPHDWCSCPCHTEH